jgi:hypothetical protein
MQRCAVACLPYSISHLPVCSRISATLVGAYAVKQPTLASLGVVASCRLGFERKGASAGCLPCNASSSARSISELTASAAQQMVQLLLHATHLWLRYTFGAMLLCAALLSRCGALFWCCFNAAQGL